MLDGQIAPKPLKARTFASKLTWDYLFTCEALAQRRVVILKWIPNHCECESSAAGLVDLSKATQEISNSGRPIKKSFIGKLIPKLIQLKKFIRFSCTMTKPMLDLNRRGVSTITALFIRHGPVYIRTIAPRSSWTSWIAWRSIETKILRVLTTDFIGRSDEWQSNAWTSTSNLI